MPIKIPDALPATKTLLNENIFVMTETRAITQDIRSLQVAVLNLMPTKIQTETQLARLLGNTPLQVELTFLHTRSHVSKHTAPEHMQAFYTSFDAVSHRKFDGFIITGAPIEQMPFEDVEYWQELCDILEWTKKNVTSTLHICWGAQAGLYYHYGIPKYPLEEKLFGVFPHVAERRQSILLRGFDDQFMVPHSRHTTIRREDVEKVEALKVLSSSPEAGLYILMTDKGRQIYITGHSEYDADTLEKEYLRDKTAGKPIEVPRNYYPNDDDSKQPLVSWRSHANLLYFNWLNYFVYQSSPYDISSISERSEENIL